LTRKRARKTETRSESEDATEALPAAQSALAGVDSASLRERNEALEKANRELQCLEDYRSEFLVRLAHELRNPLTSILGFAEILLNHEKLTTAQEDFCRKIQNSAQQIEGNLSQLSDLARLELGHTALSLGEFSLADALRESCLAVARQAHKHDVLLQWHGDNEMLAIVSDRGKVRQVLYNFLAYAINRSSDQAVVNATVEKIGPDFAVRIEDEGERLPKSFLMPVAVPLWIDQAVATNELGLAIARQLIDVLNATLTLQNRTPRGLAVTIRFPARPPDREDRS
jgi:two-component system sensor histidine kinase BarA